MTLGNMRELGVRWIKRIAVLAGHDWQHWIAAVVNIFVHPEIGSGRCRTLVADGVTEDRQTARITNMLESILSAYTVSKANRRSKCTVGTTQVNRSNRLRPFSYKVVRASARRRDNERD
jgi:hypothetical protein